MNCCKTSSDNPNNNNPNNDNPHGNGLNHKNPLSHLWMMLLCCGAPLLLVLILPVIGSAFPGARNTLGTIIPFLCPIMMVLMMVPMMLRGNK